MTNSATLGSFGDVSGSSLMFRNKIINGDMRIDQRNAGAAVGGNLFPVDRFSNQVTYGTLAFQQRSITSTDSNYEAGSAPSGFKNSIKISVSATNSSPASTDRNTFQQTIEGLNHADLDWGLSTAKPVTISFWCKASVPGVYSLALQNYAGDTSYCTTYTVNAANTWEYKTIVIAGPTTGTWPTTNASGITLRFGLGMGSQRIATSNNAWLSGDYRQATGALQFTAQANGSTLYLTGLQFEVGTAATPFEQRPVGMELALCQRYYYRYSPTTADYISNMQCFSTSQVQGIILYLPVELRSDNGVVGFSSLGHLSAYNAAGTSYTAFSSSGSVGASKRLIRAGALGGSSGLTAGNCSLIIFNTTSGWIDVSAEL